MLTAPRSVVRQRSISARLSRRGGPVSTVGQLGRRARGRGGVVALRRRAAGAAPGRRAPPSRSRSAWSGCAGRQVRLEQPDVARQPGVAAVAPRRPLDVDLPGRLAAVERVEGPGPARPCRRHQQGEPDRVGIGVEEDEQQPERRRTPPAPPATRGHHRPSHAGRRPWTVRWIRVERLERHGPVGLGQLVLGEAGLAVEPGEPRTPPARSAATRSSTRRVYSDEVSQSRRSTPGRGGLRLEPLPARHDRVARAARRPARRAGRRRRPAARARTAAPALEHVEVDPVELRLRVAAARVRRRTPSSQRSSQTSSATSDRRRRPRRRRRRRPGARLSWPPPPLGRWRRARRAAAAVAAGSARRWGRGRGPVAPRTTSLRADRGGPGHQDDAEQHAGRHQRRRPSRVPERRAVHPARQLPARAALAGAAADRGGSRVV